MASPWPLTIGFRPFAQRGLRRLGLRAPDPRERVAPSRLPCCCFRRSLRGRRPGAHWGVASAPNPDGPLPDRPPACQQAGQVRAPGGQRFAIPVASSLHGSPRMAASPRRSQARERPPIPRAPAMLWPRPLPRTQGGCATFGPPGHGERLGTEIDTNDPICRLYLLIRICLALWRQAVTNDLFSCVCNSVWNQFCLSSIPQTDSGLN